MKKVIRLTESDLTRIVKRVIKESEWTDDDERELSSLNSKYDDTHSRMLAKSKDIRSKYPNSGDEFYDEIDDMLSDPDYSEMRKKQIDLLSKKSKNQEKLRYDNVVKNRPSDYDTERYNSEYDKLDSEIDDLKKGHPYLKDYSDEDSYVDAANQFANSKSGKDLKSKRDRLFYLGKHLDSDRKKYGR
jgi:hypothetical protein